MHRIHWNKTDPQFSTEPPYSTRRQQPFFRKFLAFTLGFQLNGERESIVGRPGQVLQLKRTEEEMNKQHLQHYHFHFSLSILWVRIRPLISTIGTIE